MPWTNHPPLDRVVTDVLPAGTRVHRCYRESRGEIAFWGATDVRFGAAPRRMLYTGTTDAAAVCETLLRDPQPLPGTNRIVFPYDHLADRGLATLRLRRDATLISLCRPAVAAVIQDAAHDADVRALIETRGDYAETNRFARTLLAQAPETDVLAWPSQRADGHIVYCFYEGALSAPDFELLECEPFHTTAGYARLVEAVAVAGLQLIRATPAGAPPHDDP
jgi:hypothetical protein